MLDQILLEYGSWNLTLGRTILLAAFLLLTGLLIQFAKKEWWPKLFDSSEIDPEHNKILKRISFWILLLLFLIVAISILKLDYVFTRSENFDISISLILKAILVLQLARFLDWTLVNVFLNKYYKNKPKSLDKFQVEDPKEGISSAAQIVKYILYAIAAIVIIRSFNLDYDLYHVTLNDGQTLDFTLTSIITAILILLFARLIIWVLTQVVLYSAYRNNGIDVGAQFAINQLLKYIIYVVAIIFAFQKLGIDMTLILGGAAALLVGIGLGLQQTFNDFFSGLVLLFERSVAVGDVLDINGQVGTVKKIGLRSSIVESRDFTSTIVPNSVLVNNSVINWAHYTEKVRFELLVGVAYGSDTALVKNLLLQAAENNTYIHSKPAPFVRFNDFGDSSLAFSLYFFSSKFLIIEDIKSDLRFEVDRLFKENSISIPFPQRDVWLRKE